MRKLPSDMELLQKSCGTRVIYNGKSCIANITDKDMLTNVLFAVKQKIRKSKTASNIGQWMITGNQDVKKNNSGSRTH